MALSRRSWIGRVIGGAIAGFAAKPESSKLVYTPLPEPPEPIRYIASGAFYHDDRERVMEVIDVTTHNDSVRKFITLPNHED